MIPFDIAKAVKPKARRVESAGSADVIAMKLRHSTQSKTAAQESARKEAQSAKPKTTPRPPLPKREFTQKDLLLEALDTEVRSRRNSCLRKSLPAAPYSEYDFR